MTNEGANRLIGALNRCLLAVKRRINRVVPRLQSASSRALAGMGLLAVILALILERTGPDYGFNEFCVGLLFGLGVGIAIAAIAALLRERASNKIGP